MKSVCIICERPCQTSSETVAETGQVKCKKCSLKPCGTLAAYNRHVRKGEPIDEACAAAHRTQVRAYRRSAPQVRPGLLCERCDAPVPFRRSKFCSETCLNTKDRSLVWPRDCAECRKPFIARHPRHVTCGPGCHMKRGNRSDDYHRWKRSKRRSVTKNSDITPKQEAEMRRQARKCKLCGVYMTSKPGKPNSKHLDHIVPINVGGTHTHGNVRIICLRCNLKRPKDGSDYTGPVTLWATAPGVVIAPKPVLVPKPKPKPKPGKRRTGLCRCGNEYPIASSRQLLCHACIEDVGREAAKLRNDGWKWKDIAERLDYSNTGSLYLLASRFGQLAAPRYEHAR